MITQSDVNLLDLAINRVASADEMRRAREVVGKLTGMLERQQWAERDARREYQLSAEQVAEYRRVASTLVTLVARDFPMG